MTKKPHVFTRPIFFSLFLSKNKMPEEQEEIDWKNHLSIVIEHMFSTHKAERPGHGTYTDTAKQTETCDTCKNSYNPGHSAGCDHCFQLKFMTDLDPVKIQEYITKNKEVLTSIIETIRNWKKFQASIDSRRQSLIQDYKDLFAHGDDMFVINDQDE